MTLRTRAALSTLSLLITSACLQLPTISNQSPAGGESSGGATSVGQSGSSSGGLGTGASTGGTCIAGKSSLQLDSCGDAGECGCPLECAADPLSTPIDGQGRVCELECQTDTDCAILTACIGGVCALVACGADAGNGTYAFTCAMGDQGGLGSCFVRESGNARFSLCVAGGTSDGGCDLATGSRLPSSSSAGLPGLCIPGYLCFPAPGNGQGACSQLCDDVTTFCPAPQSCLLQLSSPNFGYCQ